VPQAHPLPLDPQTLCRTFLERDARVRSLEGTARLRVETEERAARLDATLVIERPASLRCEINDFLDHLQFLAVVRNGVLSTYSVPENLFSTGPVLPARVEEFLGVALNEEELISLLLGSPLFVAVKAPVCDEPPPGGQGVLRVTESGAGISYAVRLDRDGRPEEIFLERSGPGGAGATNRLRVVFEEYRQVDQTAFPFRIRVWEEGRERHFQVEYDEVQLNRPLPGGLFAFDPPADAERAIW